MIPRSSKKHSKNPSSLELSSYESTTTFMGVVFKFSCRQVGLKNFDSSRILKLGWRLKNDSINLKNFLHDHDDFHFIVRKFQNTRWSSRRMTPNSSKTDRKHWKMALFRSFQKDEAGSLQPARIKTIRTDCRTPPDKSSQRSEASQ